MSTIIDVFVPVGKYWHHAEMHTPLRYAPIRCMKSLTIVCLQYDCILTKTCLVGILVKVQCITGPMLDLHCVKTLE